LDHDDEDRAHSTNLGLSQNQLYFDAIKEDPDEEIGKEDENAQD
jgi:hypothetical protein